jgi:predicted RecA/RadA family phage recombinase
VADEARNSDDFGTVRYQADGTVSPYEVRQGPTGLAEVFDAAVAMTSGSYPRYTTRGQFTVAKTSGVALLKGCRVYWDHSANTATYKKVNDRDFYLGRAVQDAASTGPTVEVALNEDPPYDIDLLRDPYLTVPVGTQALGGFLPPQRRGGSLAFILSATNEAQKVDALSVDGFDTDANAIIEYVFRVPSDGAGTVVDVSVGIANGTHATDADSITESVFIHLDANNTNINAESDDGSTEVAATDTTTDYTEGSAVANQVHVWFDMRDPADVQIYVNAANVLPSSVFDVSAATGPWFLLVHLEKTSSTDTYELAIDRAVARFAEQ